MFVCLRYLCAKESFFWRRRNDGINEQFGDTALSCAADFGKIDCVRLLLEAGANTEAKDSVRDLCSNIRAFVDGVDDSMHFVIHTLAVPRLISRDGVCGGFRVLICLVRVMMAACWHAHHARAVGSHCADCCR